MPDTVPPSESINRRFRYIATTLYVVVVALLLWLFAVQWQGYRDAREARKEFTVLNAALRAMADVSSERRPTVAVIMHIDPSSDRWRDVMMAARHETDTHMQELGAAVRAPDCERCTALVPAWEQARNALAVARQRLDAMQLDPHTATDVVNGFNRIVNVIPQLSAIAETSSMGVVRENADVQSYLLVARLSGLLREQAGLIASQFAPALVLNRALTEPEAIEIDGTLGKIEQLQQLLLPSIQVLPPPLLADYDAVDRHYFTDARGLLENLRQQAARPGGAGWTLMQLSDQYGPMVTPINDLRDHALALAGDTIDQSLHWHLVYLIGSGLLALSLTALLLLMVRRFRIKVIRPFLESRRFILAIASGDLSATLPEGHYGGEVRELYKALAVLKENSARRLRLERERRRLIGELRVMAETDALTGLLNRRAFESRAKVLLSDKRQSDAVVALMMLDIDHFKRVNDTYGHESGDKALMKLASLCRETVRAEDVVARFGGEEFVILLRVQAHDQAIALAERLRRRMHEETVTSTDGQLFGFTASIGIAFSLRVAIAPVDVEALLREADALLYRAKENGRDRIEVVPGP